MVISSKVFQVLTAATLISGIVLSAAGAFAGENDCCGRRSGRLDDGTEQQKEFTPTMRQPDDGPVDSQGSGTRVEKR